MTDIRKWHGPNGYGAIITGPLPGNTVLLAGYPDSESLNAQICAVLEVTAYFLRPQRTPYIRFPDEPTSEQTTRCVATSLSVQPSPWAS